MFLRRTSTTLATLALTGGLAAAGLLAGTASAATAVHAGPVHPAAAVSRATPACTVNPYTGECNSPTVQGTPWYSNGDNMRYSATDQSSLIGHGLPGGAYATVYCYAVGQFKSNPPYSDNYWDFSSYGGHVGFISDAFLNTGGTITSQVDPCVSGLHGQ